MALRIHGPGERRYLPGAAQDDIPLVFELAGHQVPGHLQGPEGRVHGLVLGPAQQDIPGNRTFQAAEKPSGAAKAR